ncbi:MAG: hypothetical protein SOS98_06640 [Varibaculum sp.]|nr:hypothetical protein [Varibaculum sp.]
MNDSKLPGEGFGNSQDFDDELRELLEGAESAHTGQLAVIATQALTAEVLTSLAALGGVQVEAIGTRTGAVAWLRLPETEADEFDALLGEERPIPPEADKLARELSKVFPFGVVLILSWLTEGYEDQGISGQVLAQRYVKGKPDAAVPGGLLLNQLDPVVEGLVTGAIEPNECADYIPPQRISPVDAIKHLGKYLHK